MQTEFDEERTSERAHRPTSFDVALLAQVSQSTVSRALRGDASITVETRDRVARAAAELGYRPDSRAVRLRGGAVGTVAVVLLTSSELERRALNPFYFDILGAVEAAAARRGMGILLSYQSTPDSLRSDFEQRREADGLIVIGTAANRAAWDYFARARQAGSNLVAWGAPDDSLPIVRADNHAAGVLAVEHLIAAGRRRIAFVGPGWEAHQAFRLRRQGYLDVLAKHGLTPIEVTAPPIDDRHAQGEAAAAQLLAINPAIDAVFAASDTLASGIMRGVQEAGIRIPADVAIIGFDGGFGARQSTPALTTIEQDVASAGEMLVEALFGPAEPVGRSGKAFVPVQLVVRGSS